MDYMEFAESIKAKYNVDHIWSFSKLNSFSQDPYEWYLKYIMKEPSDKEGQNAYGVYGNMVHDIMEDYYNGKIVREDCGKVFQEKWDELSLLNLRFNYQDDASEKKLKNKYHDDLVDFFNNFATVSQENECEVPIDVLLEDENGKEAFFGYIDFLSKKDDKYYIIDYKTSTIYSKNKMGEHARQLLLYAIGLQQREHCDPGNIKVGWNFLKYVTVGERLKNGSIKERNIERCELVLKLENSIKKWLKDYAYSEDLYEQALITNDMSKLPEEVADKFTFRDCIVTVDFDEQIQKETTNELLAECRKINAIVDEYNKTQDDMLFWWEPTQRDEFWLYNLCSYSSNLHKPFKKYLEEKEKAMSETPWLNKSQEEENPLDSFFNTL